MSCGMKENTKSESEIGCTLSRKGRSQSGAEISDYLEDGFVK